MLWLPPAAARGNRNRQRSVPVVQRAAAFPKLNHKQGYRQITGTPIRPACQN
jgi:hypothetical protein